MNTQINKLMDSLRRTEQAFHEANKKIERLTREAGTLSLSDASQETITEGLARLLEARNSARDTARFELDDFNETKQKLIAAIEGWQLGD